MPGKSKKGGGLEVGSAYKMKNSTLRMGAKYGSPIQANFSLKNLKSRIENVVTTVKGNLEKSVEKKAKDVKRGFDVASKKRKESSKKRNVQLDALSKKLFKRKKK